MAHFAKIDSNNIVTEVIVAEQDHIDTLSGTWVQTSYNSNIRKNFAGIGSIYDSTKDAFYEQQTYASWTLNETTCVWEPPTVYPNDGKLYYWDESSTSWKE
jgi:hypothetical protein